MKNQEEEGLDNLVDSQDSQMKNKIEMRLSNLVDSGDLLSKKKNKVGLSNLVDLGNILNKKQDKVRLMNLVDSRDLLTNKSAKGLENLVQNLRGLCVDKHGNWRYNYTPDTLSREDARMNDLLSRAQSCDTSCKNSTGRT